jgi:hypothetical protein
MKGMDMGPPSPAPSVAGKSHDEMVKTMVKWFFENFEDPAEETPFESAEGGYQYIWGGPYNANEELQAAFCPTLDDPAFEQLKKRAWLRPRRSKKTAGSGRPQHPGMWKKTQRATIPTPR